MNDLQRSFDNVTLSWEIRSTDVVTASGEQSLSIAADSSQNVLPIDWIVMGEKLEPFEVAVALTDADGEILSENFHTLLIDDHGAAKAALKELFLANAKKPGTYGRSYYRFFPELQQFD